jgi:hypothetical protein
MPTVGATVPGLQTVAVALPIGQKVPSPQVMQSPTLVITVSNGSLRVPAGHGSGALDPSMQM